VQMSVSADIITCERQQLLSTTTTTAAQYTLLRIRGAAKPFQLGTINRSFRTATIIIFVSKALIPQVGRQHVLPVQRQRYWERLAAHTQRPHQRVRRLRIQV
jgi:hypothetical protein